MRMPMLRKVAVIFGRHPFILRSARPRESPWVFRPMNKLGFALSLQTLLGSEIFRAKCRFRPKRAETENRPHENFPNKNRFRCRKTSSSR
jgi:hypothetical protein